MRRRGMDRGLRDWVLGGGVRCGMGRRFGLAWKFKEFAWIS